MESQIERSTDVPTLVVIGTIGVGKTTIAEAISTSLHAVHECHALIDLDWLGQLYPPPDAAAPFALDLAFRNLTAIVPNFVAAGARRFVVAATITAPAELEALRAILGEGLLVVLLTAASETVATRITARDDGALREDFLRRTDALAATISDLSCESFRIENADRHPGEVADEVLRQAGWPGRPLKS